MMRPNANKRIAPQIHELLQYINYLDEKIARCRKQGWSPALLVRNRADAMRQVETLKQATPSMPAEEIGPHKRNLSPNSNQDPRNYV